LNGEIMDSKEALKSARQIAPFLYSKSAKDVLLRMLVGTYWGKKVVPDISVLTMKARVIDVMKWAGVTSVRQADRILKELSASGFLKILQRAKGKITYKLDPDVLQHMSTPNVQEKITARNKDRATKARAQRADNRKANRLTDAAKALRENKERFFDVVLHPISAATRRKHASLQLRAEQPAAADAGCSVVESETPHIVTRKRGPIKVATAQCAAQ
jgi:hypothetical protein